MKKNNFYLILFIFLSIIEVSCQQQEVKKISISPQSPTLTISCILRPEDSIITAYVGFTKPIFYTSPQHDYVDNAIVSLSDGDTLLNLIFNSKRNIYEIFVNPYTFVQPGKTYHLVVKTINNLTADARCTLPILINHDWDAQAQLQRISKTLYTVTLSWMDIVSQTNSYLLQDVVLPYTYMIRDANGNLKKDALGNPLIEKREIIISTFSGLGILVDDKNRDGERLSFIESFMDSTSIYALPEDIVVKPLKYKLLLLDKNLQSYLSYRDFSSIDPVAEPIIYPFAMENAIGVFGGYITLVDKK